MSQYLPLREAMDRLMEQAWAPAYRAGAQSPNGGSRVQTLPLSVYEDGERYYVHALVPGVDPGAIEITAVGDALSIRGEFKPSAPTGARAVWSEIQPYAFQREVRLAAGFKADEIQASYVNGWLQLTVPKADHLRPRQIKVGATPQGASGAPQVTADTTPVEATSQPATNGKSRDK